MATRIPEPPHDVPASIEVISGEDLRSRNATTLREALALAAGISIAPGGDAGPAIAVPEIWGLREFDAFLLVVDGIPWGGAFNPGVATLSLRDVERIEVLRGPAPGHLRCHLVRGRHQRRAQGRAHSRGHGLLRTSRTEGARTSWLTADLSVLNQQPASPHAREGSALSAATPLDANYNPRGAYLDENRLALAGGLERPLAGGAQWGSSASYTFSAQSMFRGLLTNVSNTQTTPPVSRRTSTSIISTRIRTSFGRPSGTFD